MHQFFRVLLALSGLVFVPITPVPQVTCIGGVQECKCYPRLCYQTQGCGCTLQISNILVQYTDCVFYVVGPPPHVDCVRWQQWVTRCQMWFKAKEICGESTFDFGQQASGQL